MTAHQRNVSASIDSVKLDRLAEVAVKVGLRLQPGQDLLLTAPSVALPLVRRIAEHAYKAGAGIVTPFLSDEEITLARYRHGHNESFDRAAGWLLRHPAPASVAGVHRDDDPKRNAQNMRIRVLQQVDRSQVPSAPPTIRSRLPSH